MSKITKTVSQGFSWLFKDASGKVIIVQWPNSPFALWLSLKVFLRLFPNFHQIIISRAASAVLIYWAYLELTKGDANFRRLLGAFVLTFTVLGLINGLN